MRTRGLPRWLGGRARFGRGEASGPDADGSAEVTPSGENAGETQRWLVAGLGNPGPKYAGNRHNIGFMVLDALAEQCGERWKRHKTNAQVAEARFEQRPVILAKPQSYMNLSGGPVAGLSRFYRVPLERIVVVHDELDLAYGALRLKRGGGGGGHNGLRSLTSALGGPDYVRLRMGIGRPLGRMDVAAYVLSDFSTAERKELALTVERGADAVRTVVDQGLEKAQHVYHTVS